MMRDTLRKVPTIISAHADRSHVATQAAVDRSQPARPQSRSAVLLEPALQLAHGGAFDEEAALDLEPDLGAELLGQH